MRVARSGGYSAGMAEGETKEAPPIRRGLENLAGFEPATSPFVRRRLYPLSYRAETDNGVGESVFKRPRVVLYVGSSNAAWRFARSA